MSVEQTTRTLELPDARVTYDVRGPIPTRDGRPVLLMIGQPMEASGFTALASYFGDRTVVTYDPRGLGHSTRTDGRHDNDPSQHAADLHALVEELGAGPVEVFGSSGGAVDGLALVQAHPEDVVTLVAHEPPLTHLLPADRGRRQPRRPAAVGCVRRRRRLRARPCDPGRGFHAHRRRRRHRVGPAGHRAVRGRGGGAARRTAGGLPQPSRRLPRRGVGVGWGAGGLRRAPA